VTWTLGVALRNENRTAGRRVWFPRSRVAAAAVLALGLVGNAAHALGLGKLSVQSALGETLRAEIEVTSLSPDEAGSLKVRVAPPESYRASGVEYNALLTGTDIQVVQREGRTYLHMSSDRAVQEPFVDVILELSWASGRLVREYTLLFDPPTVPHPQQVAPPAVAATPVISAPSPAPAVAPPPPVAVAAAPIAPPAPVRAKPEAPRPEASAPAPKVAAAAPAPVAPTPALKPAAAPTPASEVTVRPGDSLSRIASRVQPAGVSLDQMLVGLYRSNPDAFIDNNMNLLKAGSVLQVPSSDSLGALSAGEARQVIQAQSADFNAYRERLAGAAPTLKTEGNERQARGKVEAAVDEHKSAAAASPDKLTLSKAASATAEAKASKATEKKDAANRVAELTRNVEELKRLSAAAQPPAAAPAPVAPAPASTPTVLAQAPAALTPASVAPAPKPAASMAPATPKPQLPPAPPARPEPGLVDSLLASPAVLGGGAAVLLALGGLAFMRLRGGKDKAKADTGFHESRLQPDSFFGQSGGQRVDTRDATGAASSMSYSLSQLDAIGDVDPVAEADVYLAYGRDLQAEEILKEALRANPTRLAIRLKLLEVYAKRRDTKGFEQLAVQLYAETHGTGEDWAKAQELGRQIDPENPLYQPGGAPAADEAGHEVHAEPMDASTLPATVVAQPTQSQAPTEAMGLPPVSGFGLDLDLDTDTAANAMAATQAMTPSAERAPMGMDFDVSAPAHAAPAPQHAGGELPDLHLDLDAPGAPAAAPVHATAPAHAPAAGAENALDFDLSSIDLDLPATGATGAAAGPELSAEEAEPLHRQLELADEFRQIGDTEGAREVLNEVIEKASGELKTRAQQMLKELS